MIARRDAQQFRQDRVVPAFHRFKPRGVPAEIDRTRRDDLPGARRPAPGLAVNPFETERGAGGKQFRAHGDHLSRADGVSLAGLQIAVWFLDKRLHGEQPVPIFFNRRLLHPAPDEHQKHEDRNKIEIDKIHPSGEPRADRAGIRRDESE